MLLSNFLAALFAALFIVLIFALIGRRGPWPGLGWFFLIVLLGAWVTGTWITPVGPVFWGVAVAPFLFGALIFALLLAAAVEPSPRRTVRDIQGEESETRPEIVAVGAFFWLLVLLLTLAIFAGP